MHTAKAYATEAAYFVENTAQRITPAHHYKTHSPLPVTSLEISRYVQHLLTPGEMAACDRATD